MLADLSDEDKAQLAYHWPFWARPKQLTPNGSWRYWLMLAGRAGGKTRAGAEWCRAQIESGRCSRMTLIGRTAGEVRDVMVEGESGILSVCPPWNKPHYEPSKRRVTWPSGATCTLRSADEPDALRGLQHDGAWCDELASWRYPETWDQMLFGLRLGSDPRVVITTTPRPTPLIKKLAKDTETIVTCWPTYDNLPNVAPQFADQIIKQYEGTRLGRQELNAEILDDTPGALWNLKQIDALRVREAPDMSRIVVAVDPAATATKESSETGIVVCGRGLDGLGYVLADLTLKASPAQWGRRAVNALSEFKGERIVYEANQGGDMVAHTIRTADPQAPLRAVHASRGKRTRAEPIAALYEQGRIKHVGAFPKLEDQMTSWNPDDPRAASPDRMDAMVWAFTDLLIDRPSMIAMPAMSEKKEASEGPQFEHKRGRLGW